MGTRCNSRPQIGESPVEIVDKRIKEGGVSVILAVDKKFNIGIDGDMLFRIEEDLKRFKKFTLGKNLYMGSGTFRATGPLPERKMIVLSRGEVEGADEVIHDVDEFRNRLINDKNAFLIGGAHTINSFIDDVRYFYLTMVDKEFEADTSIEDPIKHGFTLDKESEVRVDEKTGLQYKYLEYGFKSQGCGLNK